MVEEYIEKIMKNMPSIIINVIFIGAFIIYLIEHIQVIKDTALLIWSFIRKYIIDIYWRYERKRYNAELMNSTYIQWQLGVIKKIYEELLQEYRSENDISEKDLHITELTFEAGEDEEDGISREYESYTWKMKEIPYPFDGICDKEYLTFLGKTDFKSYKDYLYRDEKINVREMKMINRYASLVKRTIRFPNRIGYMLDEMYFDENRNLKVKAHVGTYMQNVLQSHILEYELYRFYCKCFKKVPDWDKKLKAMSRKEIMEHLPLRKRIHASQKKECEIFCSGAGRDSLLSVQIMVMVKNYSGSYDCLRIRRSENVAAKAGYIQLIPSGGFESINSDMCREAQWTNYSLNKVLFRELAEECFGLPDDEKNDKMNPEAIYYHTDIEKVVKGLIGENKTVEFEFLGVAESLVGLRPEFCFLMKIDNMDLVNDISCNEESDKQIHLIDIRTMEKKAFWQGEKNEYDDLTKFNCTSAALFELVRQSNLYQECLKGK